MPPDRAVRPWIRHHPAGSGDPYHLDPDQRHPVIPICGTPLTVGVLTSANVDAVTLEWAHDGQTTQLPVRRLGQVGRDGTWSAGQQPRLSDGHLAAAATRTRKRGLAWSVQILPPPYAHPARYRLHARAGQQQLHTTWQTVATARWQHDRGQLTVRDPAGRLVSDSVTWLADTERVHRLRFALTLSAREHVIGFGERFDRLDQRGHSIDSVVFEQYKDQAATGRTYLPMPFAHVVGDPRGGWGFHIRTSRRTWFDVGETDPNAIWVEVDLGDQRSPHAEVATYTGGPADVLREFLTDTGRPTPLPGWIHRLWISGNEWNSQRRIREIVDRHRDEHIPVGAVVIEAWSDENTFVAFRDAAYQPHPDGAPHRLAEFAFRDDGAWPDPKGMVDELHRRGIRVLLWQVPLQKMRPHPAGQAKLDAATMIERGYCVHADDGKPYRNRGWWFPLALLPDFSNPEARSWWLHKRRYLVEEIGIDGFKTDGGEHPWGHDLRYASGQRGDEGNNLYPLLYAAAYGELLRQAGKPPVTFSRAGYTGSQAHGCVWAGDQDSTWPAYRACLTAGLTAAASGVLYWGWDLAGFSGPLPSAELYLRSAAAACFAPIMQYHSEYNHHRARSRDRTPWNVAEFTGNPDVLTIFRQFACLRDRLVPYLTAQATASIAASLPVMRPLFLAYPHDEHIWRYPTEYLLGDALLVCPVTEPGARAWRCYLPRGEWTEVWTGRECTGPAELTVASPLDRIPAWCETSQWPSLQPAFAPFSPLTSEG